ncbi:aryl-sulfate sulfotransferase [Eudoraea sp.]|uniref:aryl-sulfate sulfotransferase n=1 Tax=Eudoraea sp. TaxID=1979955 RepID=UPI003C7291DC
MKKAMRYCCMIAILALTYNCVEKESEKTKDKKDRNMFGHRIPRGLTKTSENLLDGYLMYAVPNSPMFYLINRRGEVVHQWKGNYDGFVSYLMDDGSLMVGALDPDFPTFGFGGPYGRLQKISWDGKMLWDYEYAARDSMIHHDFAVKPDGNILALAYKKIPYEQAIEMGRKPEYTPLGGPWLEKIVEIEPQGKDDGKIVWEWRIEDHLIQDYDSTKLNFGKLEDHPELISFNVGDSVPPVISQDSVDVLVGMGRGRNLTTNNRGSDLFHLNAINYNAELDQIAFSSPELSEVFIIDRGVTSTEARGHSGGKRGKGGDILYRWGNPQNYNLGDSTDRKLYYQHDIRWIEKGKPGAGNLTLYNNDVPMGPDSLNYSTIYELNPPINAEGSYDLQDNNRYGPEEPYWTYVAKDTLSFYGSFISGAHRMENGNTFINEGPKGRFFEVTPEGDMVWEYLNPYRGDIRKPDGEPHDIMPTTYFIFRATFIPADHPAFEGKELKPLDPQPEVFKLPPPPPEDDQKDE